MHATRFGWVMPLIAVLSVIGPAPASTAVELDRTTVVVTVAEANAHCLVETMTMTLNEAQSLATGFVEAQKISDRERAAVRGRSDFDDLMGTYIADQGGCSALVEELKR